MVDASLEKMVRLEDWIPLDMEGKPFYHEIDEHGRSDMVRPNITLVRKKCRRSRRMSCCTQYRARSDNIYPIISRAPV